MELLYAGIGLFFDPVLIAILFGAVFLGISIGSLPGLTAVMGVAILSPFTYNLPAQAGVLALVGIYVGANYGGSIAATLLNIPGTPAAVATAFDAHPMAKRGEAGRAIGIATVSSAVGGLISAVALIFISPLIAAFALNFTSIELFCVAVLGLSIIIFIAEENYLKGFIAAVFGLLIAAVGADPMSSHPRFTFNQLELYTGVNFILVMIGLFGGAESLAQLEKEEAIGEAVKKIGRIFPGLRFLWNNIRTIIRSAFIGIFVGAVPGTGATIAAIVAYGQQKRLSKHPEKMGHGAEEGIVAAETSNNACCGGAITTMLSLGIPGDAVTAIIIGQFLIQGLRPGPMLFEERPDLVGAIFLGFIVANLFMLAIGLSAARLFANLLKTRRVILQPCILALCFVGSFAIQNQIFDVGVMVLFSVVGYAMIKLAIPRAPIVLALILGPLMESNLRRSFNIYGDGFEVFSAFIHRPLAVVIALLTVLLFLYPLLKGFVSRKK
ncbi:MAG: hypothetical protein DELT_00261 [Desulfovibrio sp.]